MAQEFVPLPGAGEVCVGMGLDVNAWHANGRALIGLGRLDDAEAVFRQILAVNAQDAVAWCLLGTIWEARPEYQDAEAAYRRAIVADARLFDARQFVGKLEQAYVTMWEIFYSGESPVAFKVG